MKSVLNIPLYSLDQDWFFSICTEVQCNAIENTFYVHVFYLNYEDSLLVQTRQNG
jgi:hypothetical protein